MGPPLLAEGPTYEGSVAFTEATSNVSMGTWPLVTFNARTTRARTLPLLGAASHALLSRDLSIGTSWGHGPTKKYNNTGNSFTGFRLSLAPRFMPDFKSG
jgi:hypothetical protein